MMTEATNTLRRKLTRLMRPMVMVLPLVVALAACRSGVEETAPATSATIEVYSVPTAKTGKAWERVGPDVQPPRFLTMNGQVPKGYKLWNGRILWVEEKGGIGRIIANPDESNPDQWTCPAILGDVSAFYEKTEDIPNFTGVICHPYKVVTDFP